MDQNRFTFWQRWLTGANLFATLIGVLVAFAGNSIFFELHNFYSAKTFFSSESMTPEVLQFKNWLFGIIGGTIIGFHLLIVMISENAFKKKERWAYLAIWYSMLSWFVVDSGLSLYYGALHNVMLINMGALIMICIPLIATRKEFLKSTSTID